MAAVCVFKLSLLHQGRPLRGRLPAVCEPNRARRPLYASPARPARTAGPGLAATHGRTGGPGASGGRRPRLGASGRQAAPQKPQK